MDSNPSQEDIICGQAIYTKKTLFFYDFLVTRFSNYFAWRCPRKILLDHFQRNITKNHLDIGVGTGYFLKKMKLSPKQQRLGLLDLNSACLIHAAKKLSHLHPEIYQHNIFDPFVEIKYKFDSVSLNYVLHCLPGNLMQKAIIFDHIKAILNPGGKLFSSTILGRGVNKNGLSNKLIKLYNQKKIFDNLSDDIETLHVELLKRFNHVAINLQGCVALFSATIS